MKLYTYQEQLLSSTSKKVLINWCRGAGKDTAVAAYILEKKPSKVLIYGYSNHLRGLLESFQPLKEGNSFFIEKTENNKHIITFPLLNKNVEISLSSESEHERQYDLVIEYDLWKVFNVDKDAKHIKVITENVVKLNNYESYSNFEIIEVDHKKMIKENLETLDMVLKFANNKKSFYRDFALSTAPIEEEMSFSEFQNKALIKLQKQFLDTPDSKDTVLTRKNIIEMIKDLKEMGLK